MAATATRTKSSTAKKAPAKKASAKPTLKKGTSIAKNKSSAKKAPVKKTKAKKTEVELKTKDPNKKKKGFHMLSAFSILFIIIAILVVVSWILHWTGVQADYTAVGETTERHQTISAMGLVDIFYSVFLGFAGKTDIIVFILVLGAFITIVINSKALEGFANGITKKLKGKEVYAIIPLMLFFSICGTVEGMAEESLGFYMICIPLVMAAGFDVFTGLLVVLLGAGIGVLTSTVNPFVVSVAADGLNGGLAKMAGVDAATKFITVGDGLVWRLVVWLLMTAAAIAFVMWYAMRVKKNPQKSVTFSTYQGDKAFFLGNQEEQVTMDWRKKLTLAIFGFTFLIMIAYLIGWDSILGGSRFEDAGNTVKEKAPYVTALVDGFGIGSLMVPGMFFLIASIVVGLVNGLGEDNFISQFMAGAGDILSVCLIIATAGGVGVILQDSGMQSLFVKGLAGSVGSIPAIGRIVVLYFIFLVLSFIIPSSSGFAAAIFPILAGVVTTQGVAINSATGAAITSGALDPASLVDPVAGSGSILAFSMANGLLNLFTPTSGVVMGAVAIARMDYGKFLKGMAPIIAGTAVLSVVFLAAGGGIATVAGSIA